MPLGLRDVEPLFVCQLGKMVGNQLFAFTCVTANLHFDQPGDQHVHPHFAVSFNPLGRDLHCGEISHAAQHCCCPVPNLAQAGDRNFAPGHVLPRGIERRWRHGGEIGKCYTGEGDSGLRQRGIGERAWPSFNVPVHGQPAWPLLRFA